MWGFGHSSEERQDDVWEVVDRLDETEEGVTSHPVLAEFLQSTSGEKRYTEEEMEADRRLHAQIIKDAVLASKVKMLESAIGTRLMTELRKERPSLTESDGRLAELLAPFLQDVHTSAVYWLTLHQVMNTVCSMDSIHIERWLFSFYTWKAQRYIANLPLA